MNRKNIILNDSAKIDLTCQGSLNDILIVGNFNGMFGRINESGLDLSGEPSEEIINNFMWLNDTCRDAKKVFIGTRSSVGDYVKNMMAAAENLNIQINRDKYNIILVDSDDALLNKLNEISHTMPKFDYIIQNPPYAKTLHIDFFKKGIELLNDTGKMTIIEPATWLINIRKSGNAKRIYNPLKEMIAEHVEYINIDNMNDLFGKLMFVPFSITRYAKQKTQDCELRLCGTKQTIKSIYDANLIGDYDIIHGILHKIEQCGYDKALTHFNRYGFGDSFIRACSLFPSSHSYLSHLNVADDILGTQYYMTYVSTCMHHNDRKIYNETPKTKTGRTAEFLNGSYQEISNWKHFCENNTLPIFINICMTIDQHNNSLKYIPWLVDKQYTDQEIYEMFGFTEQEINLIEYTVEKFQYSSPFFKRYMCGPSKVSDQEVQEYINQLKKKHNIDY